MKTFLRADPAKFNAFFTGTPTRLHKSTVRSLVMDPNGQHIGINARKGQSGGWGWANDRDISAFLCVPRI